MTDLTIDAIQALYFKTKDEVAELSKRHGAEMKPFADRLELCKNWMAKFLTDTGQESAKTEHGLTYKSNILQCSVEGDNGWEKPCNESAVRVKRKNNILRICQC